jgi:hypothetical protein
MGKIVPTHCRQRLAGTGISNDLKIHSTKDSPPIPYFTNFDNQQTNFNLTPNNEEF